MGETREVSGTGSRLELPYLDGLRALAALGVVAYHSFLYTGLSGQAEAELPIFHHITRLGSLGVPVFIVISGYVLMLPLLKSPDYRFSRGVGTYIKRRAKRILPPYYAALIFTLALIIFIPVMGSQSGTEWDSKLPLTPGAIISHFLLLHDLSPDWILKINGPMWSVAVEWQIYFLMPLILLPLWRRVNPYIVVGAAILVTSLPAVVGFGSFIHPWFVGLFAVGMLAAQVTVGRIGSPRLGWPLIGLIGVSVLVMVFFDRPLNGTQMPLEVIIGVTVAVGLAWLGTRTLSGRKPGVARVLEARPLMAIGLFSYSIYLFHSPMLALGNLLLLPLGLPIGLQYLVMMVVVVPIDLFLCWLLFLAVERNFLNTHQKKVASEVGVRRAEESAPVARPGADGIPDPAAQG